MGRARAVIAGLGALVVIVAAGNVLAVHPTSTELLLGITAEPTASATTPVPPGPPTAATTTTTTTPIPSAQPTAATTTPVPPGPPRATPTGSTAHPPAPAALPSSRPTTSSARSGSSTSASGRAPSTVAPTTTARTTPARTTTPAPTSAPTSAGRVVTGYVTAYTWYDNDPPGPAIADPVLHAAAGGAGTYADPVTIAVAAGAFAPGTRLYLPHVRRYFVVEDTCASCGSRPLWVDMWIDGRSGGESDVQECASRLTGDVTVEIDPPPGRAVAAAPLFGPDGCYRG